MLPDLPVACSPCGLWLRGDEGSRGKNANNDSLNILGNNIDAGTMAKAIKTILTRDDKG